ncbi:MAG: FkbM family methyltransferase [Chitinophagaceae bacterium]
MSSNNNNSLWSAQKIKSLIRQRLGPVVNPPYRKFNLSWLQVKRFKHAAKNKQYVHNFKSGLPIHFTDPQAFLLSVRELFIEEIYRFRPSTPNPRILDCGAHIGMSILFFKHNYPGAVITAFEPDSANFALASKNLDSWNLKNVEILPKAIWIHNEEIQFQQTHDMGSSIVDSGEISSDAVVRIPCQRLRDLLEGEIDFLKLDIEGAEYEVIKDCGDRLRNIKNIFLEYHGNYDEMYKLTTMLQILTEQNFAYYIKEAGTIYQRPFYDNERHYSYDVQLNIFCMRRD